MVNSCFTMTFPMASVILIDSPWFFLLFIKFLKHSESTLRNNNPSCIAVSVQAQFIVLLRIEMLSSCFIGNSWWMWRQLRGRCVHEKWRQCCDVTTLYFRFKGEGWWYFWVSVSANSNVTVASLLGRWMPLFTQYEDLRRVFNSFDEK